MSQPTHLGVLCVDVSELLKPHSRLKVKRRDNMLLYRRSYLITDPVPTTPTPLCVSGRSASDSPMRGHTTSARGSRSSSTSTLRRRRRSRRRSSRKRRGNENQREGEAKNDDDCDETSDNDSGCGGYPLEPDMSVGSQTTISGATPKKSTTSKRYGRLRKPHTMIPSTPEEEEEEKSYGASISGWRTSKRDFSPLRESREAAVEGGSENPQAGRKYSSMHYSVSVRRSDLKEKEVERFKRDDQERPGQRECYQNDQTDEKKQQQQGQQYRSSSFDFHSDLSESAQRTINSVLASVRQRALESAHRMRLSPVEVPQGGVMPTYEMISSNVAGAHRREWEDHSKSKNNNTETNTSAIHVTMVGPVGASRVSSSPNPWSHPRLQSLASSCHRSPIRTNRAAAALSDLPPHRMRDKNGRERVLLMGVVPTLPKPVLRSPLRAARDRAPTSLPPALRRIARVAATPSNRPKRF